MIWSFFQAQSRWDVTWARDPVSHVIKGKAAQFHQCGFVDRSAMENKKSFCQYSTKTSLLSACMDSRAPLPAQYYFLSPTAWTGKSERISPTGHLKDRLSEWHPGRALQPFIYPCWSCMMFLWLHFLLFLVLCSCGGHINYTRRTAVPNSDYSTGLKLRLNGQPTCLLETSQRARPPGQNKELDTNVCVHTPRPQNSQDFKWNVNLGCILLELLDVNWHSIYVKFASSCDTCVGFST